jgi:hypothetical protein
MTGRRLWLGVCVLGPILWAARAVAGPTLITTRPASEDVSDRITFLVGGIDESGRSLKASTLDLAIDGHPVGTTSVQTLADWATASAEASQAWRPPLSVGLVYLWIEGVPAGVLDGIHAFFQRVSSRTVVYPTIYGRLRQGRARLTAADISRLDEIPYLDGYRPNMIEAIRLNLADLAADPAALKVLLVVTDGRDFADPKGENPGDFAAIGAELRRAGVTVLVAGFRPEADSAQAAANLRDLHDAAGGFLSARDQVEDLENTLESLGQGLADLQRVELPLPWTWRLFGGSHRVSVHLNVATGESLTAEVGTVAVGPGNLRWLLILIAVALLMVAGAVTLMLRRRVDPGESPPSAEKVVAAAHNLIRRGASPERAVEELKRNHADAIGLLVNLDEGLLSDPRFPYLRTRPGRKRMQEIRDLLTKRAGDRPHLGESLARVLAEGVTSHMPPDDVAHELSAHATAEERSAFGALDFEQLAEALRGAARAHPALGSPRARGAVVAIQDALKAGENQTRGVSVGWLVRAGGPGRRGETLRLDAERTVIGQAPGCAIRIVGDSALAPEHAEISIEDGEFSIAPLGGAVKIEGQSVGARQTLVDGETIDLGGGIYVFKSASVGKLAGLRADGRSLARR